LPNPRPRPVREARTRKPKRPRTITLGHAKRRLWASVAVVAVLLTVVLVRLTWLQGLDAGGYALAASDERAGQIALHAERGAIVDRNGVPLAYTADAKDIVADPSLVTPEKRQAYAEALAPVLKKSAAVIADLLVPDNADDKYALLASALPPSVAEQVDGLRVDGVPLTGIYAQATLQRMYPAGNVGSNVIGILQADGTGGAGIEEQYDAVLHGTDGTLRYEKDSIGNINPAGPIKRTAPLNGGTVQLTIDRDLQFRVQQALDAMVAKSGAHGGQVAVLDAKTGQVLALSGNGTFNPQDPSTISPNRSMNPTVQDVFEPGSANKIVTMAAALEKGIINPMTTLDVPDTIQVNDVWIHDAWWHPTQKFTATGVLAESSNVGTIEIAQKVGEQPYFDYLKKFGLGQKTGIELPGESGGLLPDISQWSSSTFANLPIGQGVAMTIVQLASMYQTLANDGVRIPPRIVSSVTSSDGKVTPTATPAGVRVVSEKTARTLRTMLESVTMEGGTGKKAAIAGYRIGGKTGTAQQIDPATGRYSNSAYWLTFAGIAPTDNPRFVVAVMIDRASGQMHGGDICAPLFHDIAAYELAAEKIPPSGSLSRLVPLHY
jgi:cell division protein FtsI (penicillin-binding protein 3)